MSDERLPTHIWVDAHLRRCSVKAVSAVIIHKGEKMGGTVMLKIYQPDIGCRLLSQMRDLDGNLSWYPAHKEDLIDEPLADERIRRAIDRDPDLWVIEMETRNVGLLLDEPIGSV